MTRLAAHNLAGEGAGREPLKLATVLLSRQDGIEIPSSALNGGVALEKQASVSSSVRWAHSRTWQGGSEDGRIPTSGRDELHSLLGCLFP